MDNFGDSKKAVGVMQIATNVIKEIHTKALSESYIQNERNKIEIQKNIQIKKEKEISVIYLAFLLIISLLFILIFSFYFRKAKQNKILNKQNEIIKTKELENTKQTVS